MQTAVEKAVDTFIRAWSEPDAQTRAAMVDACFAIDGRLVARQSVIHGRAALAEAMTRVNADAGILKIRLVRDGTTTAESLDTGEIDDEGRIRLILTFAGPLRDAGA
jgi:hypothetical protein